MKEFAGKVAVVTGGARGMGLGMSRALAREGCKVVIADILEDDGEAAADAVQRAGGTASSVVCDVSDRASVRALHSAVIERFGAASLLIANAGVTLFKPFTEMTDDEIDWVLQTNLNGVVHCLQMFLPDMIEKRCGHVVATSSFSGLLSPYLKDHAPYVAAKAGVIGMMLSMRRELADVGVGATVLCPGKVATQITESLKYRPKRFGGATEGSIVLPLGENTQPARHPDEVAQMVLRGVRENRAVVVTDAGVAGLFREGYCEAISSAFEAAALWDSDAKD